jgi:hypothetical protein
MKTFLGIRFLILIFQLLTTLFCSLAYAIGCPQQSFNRKKVVQMPEDNRKQDHPKIWGKFGSPFDDYLGVIAYSNLADGQGGKFQCTELIHRFMKDIYGVPTRLGMGLGHAKDLAQNLAIKFPISVGSYGPVENKRIHFIFFPSACTSVEPSTGSLVSLQAGKFGHIAVVRRVKKINNDEIRIELFEQHGELSFKIGQHKPIRGLTLRRTMGGIWYHPKVIGWLVPIFSD